MDARYHYLTLILHFTAFYEWLVREVLNRRDNFLYSDAASAKKLADIHLCETTELKPFLLYNGTRSELDLLWIKIMLFCPCYAPAFSFLLNRFFSFLCKEILFAPSLRSVLRSQSTFIFSPILIYSMLKKHQNALKMTVFVFAKCTSHPYKIMLSITSLYFSVTQFGLFLKW